MTKPETKTVLGRVFTWNEKHNLWACPVSVGTIELWLEDDCLDDNPEPWGACLATPVGITAATGRGHTEADAILALQATLRKMAELEVVE